MIADKVFDIRQRISAAAIRSGRNPDQVKLVAVTKTVETIAMRDALNAGITSFAENRVQELVRKSPSFPEVVDWHLIGHLQTNKVKQVVGKVELIHSLDRISLAKELSTAAQSAGIDVAVLVQVNVSGEDSKQGVNPGATAEFITEVAQYPGLLIQGLMTMAPYVSNSEEVRPVFKGLALLARGLSELNVPRFEMRWLSMGMTNDFEIAIEEGANLVRIGSGIFGSRI